MRWPWSKIEKRESGGDFSDAIVRLLEAQAAGIGGGCFKLHGSRRGGGWGVVEGLCIGNRRGRVLGAGNRHAVFPGAMWARSDPQQAIRCTLRVGSSGGDGATDSVFLMALGRISRPVELVMPSNGLWAEHKHDWNLPASSIVFVRWGSTPGQVYTGTGPLSLGAYDRTAYNLRVSDHWPMKRAGAIGATACYSKLTAATTPTPIRSRCSGPIFAPHAAKRCWSKPAQAGWDQGRAAAPQRDWKPCTAWTDAARVHGCDFKR